MLKEYRIIKDICKKRLIVRDVDGVRCNDFAYVMLDDGAFVLARVIEIEFDRIHLQLFGNANGIKNSCKIRFVKSNEMIPLSIDVFGRVLDGMGRALDGGAELLADKYTCIYPQTINVMARDTQHFSTISTGLNVVDGFCPLIKGRKTSVVAEDMNSIIDFASKIAVNSRIVDLEGQNRDLAVVVALIGVSVAMKNCFIDRLDRAGAMSRTAVFASGSLNSAFDSVLTARTAMNTADYLAFEKGQDVLLIILDATSFLNSGKTLAKEGGYDFDEACSLSSLFDGAGILRSREGSVTLLSCFSTDSDSQKSLISKASDSVIALNKELLGRGNSVPVDVLNSFVRLSGSKLDAERSCLAESVRREYSKAYSVLNTMRLLGMNALSIDERQKIEYLEGFEREFLNENGQPCGDILTKLKEFC